jgi:hypothetical protein
MSSQKKKLTRHDGAQVNPANPALRLGQRVKQVAAGLGRKKKKSSHDSER